MGQEPGQPGGAIATAAAAAAAILNWRMEEEAIGGWGELGCRGMAGQPYRRQEALASGRPCGSERLRHGAAIPQYNGGPEQSRTESDVGKRGAPCLSLSALFPPPSLAPPTSGTPLPRVTRGMKTRAAGQGGGLEAGEAGVLGTVTNRLEEGGASLDNRPKDFFRAARVVGGSPGRVLGSKGER